MEAERFQQPEGGRPSGAEDASPAGERQATRVQDDSVAADRHAVKAVRGGDRAAYARIVRRHGPALYRVVVRILRDEHLAEDVVQETFVKAWSALDRYDSTRPLFPWLRAIAVRAALNELRRRERRKEVAEGEEVLPMLSDAARSDAALEMHELHAAVEEAIENLPAVWAAVFRLRVQEELGYAEIARALDIPLGSVMSSLSRARRRVARSLNEMLAPRENDDTAGNARGIPDAEGVADSGVSEEAGDE